MSARALLGTAFALAVALVAALAASPARPHGGEHGEGSKSESAVLAPGYGPLGFSAPEPGSYALPPLGTAADGPVLRSDGSATTLYEVFADRLVVLSFIYASCSDVNGCPLATTVLQGVQARLRAAPALESRVQVASLSFDPERDTPEVMAHYAKSFSKQGPPWAFLTAASQRELEPTLEAYGQSLVEEVDAEGQPVGRFSHILRVFLIDAEKRIRNTYTVSFLHADTLLADVETLVLEERQRSAESGIAANGDAEPIPAEAGAPRSGDYRQGYDTAGFETRSRALAARRGREADLLARLEAGRLGLPRAPVPDDNPLTQDKVALGRQLFFDRRLSLNGTFSCAMCHIPEQGFTSNEMATAVGIEGRTVRRNSPSLYDVAHAKRLFHDARETRLEQQIWGPLLARNEMGNPSIGVVVDKLRGLDPYAEQFETAFPGRGLGMETLGMALASYQRTLVTGDSPFDRWRYGADESALSAEAKRGFELFSGEAGCSGCHAVGPETALFTDHQLHNTGVGYARSMGVASPVERVQVAPGEYLDVDRRILAGVSEPVPSDLGRYEITQDPADRWRYKTPALRNVALTAPYMHDGSLPGLADVVAFYSAGGVPNESLDPRIRRLDLEPQQQADLVAFLESLTGSDIDVLVRDAFAAPVGNVSRSR